MCVSLLGVVGRWELMRIVDVQRSTGTRKGLGGGFCCLLVKRTMRPSKFKLYSTHVRVEKALRCTMNCMGRLYATGTRYRRTRIYCDYEITHFYNDSGRHHNGEFKITLDGSDDAKFNLD